MLCLKLFLTLRTTPIPKVHPPHGPLDPPPLSVIALSQQSRGAGLSFDIRHSFRRRKGHLEQVTRGDPEAVWSQGPRCSRKTPAALTKQTPRETLAPPYLLISLFDHTSQTTSCRPKASFSPSAKWEIMRCRHIQ